MKHYQSHTFIPYGHGDASRSFCVLLIRNEIAYDLDYTAVSMAKLHFADAPAKVQKDLVLSVQQEDWLDRQIKSAVSKVRNSIRFAVPRESRMASDEILESPTQYALPLVFEKEWNGEPSVLCDAIHTYVVKKCLAEWAITAVPERVTEFYAYAEEALTEVHDIACMFSYDTINPIL